MWFLDMFDGNYETKFNHILDVFFGSDSSNESRDIHQLAKEFSNFERKVNPTLA
jgi:hypothetical protein